MNAALQVRNVINNIKRLDEALAIALLVELLKPGQLVLAWLRELPAKHLDVVHADAVPVDSLDVLQAEDLQRVEVENRKAWDAAVLCWV